jgi:hypothetical protein
MNEQTQTLVAAIIVLARAVGFATLCLIVLAVAVGFATLCLADILCWPGWRDEVRHWYNRRHRPPVAEWPLIGKTVNAERFGHVEALCYLYQRAYADGYTDAEIRSYVDSQIEADKATEGDCQGNPHKDTAQAQESNPRPARATTGGKTEDAQ